MEENKEIIEKQETAIVERGLIHSIDDMQNVASIMMQSGLFKDIKSQAQAFVKIMAGQELGIGAFAAMRNIYIIEGQTTLSAGLMASKVKAHPKYDYRIKHLDNDGCILEFFEIINDQPIHVGDSAFDRTDADKAGLSSKFNWKSYPRNMYFSRAISNGVRFFCPDVFYGTTVYTPEEINPDWAIDGSFVIDEKELNKTNNKNEPKIDQKPIGNKRPYDPEILKSRIATFAEKHANETASEGQRGLMVSGLNTCYAGKDADMKRHEALQFLTGEASSKKLLDNFVLAILDWLHLIQDSGGAYIPDEMAVREAQTLLTFARTEAGQQDLFEGDEK